MTLHPINLPKSAVLLFRVVVLQKRLLRALAEPALQPTAVNETWLQRVWSSQQAEWVRKFCLGGKQSVLHPLRVIAAAPAEARSALYSEFRRQNKVSEIIKNAGGFQDLAGLSGSSRELTDQVVALFNRCYELLSHDARGKWSGYEIGCRSAITNQIYKDDFCKDYPASVVCPYCDGSIGTPLLDHYFPKSLFPLLACSPWNLVPVCDSCNRVNTGKGDRLPLTVGSPQSTANWLHPFFRPASNRVQIQLTGKPKDSIPRLHSPDAVEQARLDNHNDLIPSLGSRWTKIAAAYYDCLVGKVRRRTPAVPIDTVVRIALEDHVADRGRSPSSMVHAAVCQAVLDRRPEYLEEFASPNAPQLS